MLCVKVHGHFLFFLSIFGPPGDVSEIIGAGARARTGGLRSCCGGAAWHTAGAGGECGLSQPGANKDALDTCGCRSESS